MRIAHLLACACTALALAATPACDDKKADDKKADDKKADDKKADDKKADDKKADDKKAEAPAAADALVITANHAEPKPTDPVMVTVTGLKVTKADFDPANIEGGSAEIEIDLDTLSSGSDKRDKHLKSPDYLDLTAYPTVSVSVSDVKKVGDGYTANVLVKAGGKAVTWEATPFTVLATTDTGIKISLERKFTRSDFGIGEVEGDSVANELSASLTMTIDKT